MKTKIQTIVSQIMVAVLNAGVVLAASHGVHALVAVDNYFNHVDFAAKVQSDQHTHTDSGSTFKALNKQNYIDPRSLRRIRSEGDKVAENDRDLSCWDAYCA